MPLTEPHRTTVREKLRPVLGDDDALDALMAQIPDSPDTAPVTEATFRAEVDPLRADVTQLRTDVTQLRTDVTELRTDVTQLRTDVDGLRTDFGEMRHEFAIHRMEVRSDMRDMENRLLKAWISSQTRLIQIFLAFVTAYMAIVLAAVQLG